MRAHQLDGCDIPAAGVGERLNMDLDTVAVDNPDSEAVLMRVDSRHICCHDVLLLESSDPVDSGIGRSASSDPSRGSTTMLSSRQERPAGPHPKDTTGLHQGTKARILMSQRLEVGNTVASWLEAPAVSQ